MIRPRPLGGKDKQSVWLMDLLRYVDSLKVVDASGLSPTRSNRGTILERRDYPINTHIRRLVIKSYQETFLQCAMVEDDGTEIPNSVVNVMVPYNLANDAGLPEGADDQSIDWDPVAQTRTFDIVDGQKKFSIEQGIYPPYKVDDFIFAINKVTGGTVEVSGEHLQFIDLNIDARHWAYVLNDAKVCVNDELKDIRAIVSEPEEDV